MKRDTDISFLKYGDVAKSDRRRVKRAIAKRARRAARTAIQVETA